MNMRAENIFKTLNPIKCKTEKKGRFNYVTWTDAWEEVKRNYPTATFKVYETEQGFPAFINSTGGFVKVGVTIEGLEYIENYPILNFANKAIKKEDMNVFDINTAIKRAMTKALAYHGLGLYIYKGEDLPTEEAEK